MTTIRIEPAFGDILKLTEIDPSNLSIEEKNEIYYNNMRAADTVADLNYFTYNAIGWIKNNKPKNYKDLELELRNRDFNARIIAMDIPASHTRYHKAFLHGVTKKYYVHFSCGSKDYTLQELLRHRSSEAENLSMLNNTGYLTIGNGKFTDPTLIYNGDNSQAGKMVNCKTRIDLCATNNATVYKNYIINHFKKNYNFNITLAPYVKFDDGSIVYLFKNNTNLVSGVSDVCIHCTTHNGTVTENIVKVIRS